MHTRSSSRSLALCGATLIGIGATLLAPRPAAADASLTNASDSSVLEEARFAHDIEIFGTFAVVESTQVISNPSGTEQQAVYTFDLPVNAAVTGTRIRLSDGRTTTTAVVDEVAVTRAVSDPDSISAMPDVGLLRLIARDKPGINGPSPFAKATYELRVAPVAARKTVRATVRWMAPLRHIDGRLTLRVPARGDAGNLVREQVSVSVRPPAGIRGFSEVHAGGKRLGKNPRNRRTSAPTSGDLLIEATLDFGARKDAPVVSFGAVPLGRDLGAVGVAILSPKARGRSQLTHYERALFIVDASRSMSGESLRAASQLADGLLSKLPERTRVELITYDRAAKRAFGTFAKNTAKTRKRLARALNLGVQENGSSLDAALELARKALRRNRPRRDVVNPDSPAATLVVVLTDGMIPLALDSNSAIAHIGSDVLDDVELFPIVLVPENAPMPDVSSGVLADLAHATSNGRTLAMRVTDAKARASKLPEELNRPAPLTDLRLETGNSLLTDVVMPFSLTPGQGFIRVGIYRGPAPRQMVLHARQRNAPVTFKGKRLSHFAKRGAPLALVGMVPADFVPKDARIGSDDGGSYDEDTLVEARRSLIKAAQKLSTVTRHSALVALATQDRFARDRLAMVQKWGAAAYMRLPPVTERDSGDELPTYEDRDGDDDPDRADPRRTGEIDRGIIKRLLENHVIPKARGCYKSALRKNTSLKGALVVVVEVARGEVQYAGTKRSTFANTTIDQCVVEAAYSMQIPRVALGDDPETVGVANYPLSFKPGNGGRVEAGTYSAPEIDELVLDGDPLGGLPAGGGDEVDTLGLDQEK